MSTPVYRKGMKVQMTDAWHKQFGFLPPMYGTVAHNPRNPLRVAVVLSHQSTPSWYHPSFIKPA